MHDATEDEKLLRRLVSLVRTGRTFGHRNQPLYWHEIRHLRIYGRRYLSQLYGKSSPELRAFTRLTAEAFSPLPPRCGYVEKEGSNVILNRSQDAEAASRVWELNKLDLHNALQILIEAAHSLRASLGRQNHSSPLDASAAQMRTPKDEVKSRKVTRPPAGTNDAETISGRRLAATITSSIAARRMESHLARVGIGQTDFAIQVSTTDRTLRRFRKTGKVRRDIFDRIAKGMGTTKEDLLKSE